MKNIIVGIVVILIVGWLYFAYIQVVQKAMHAQPPPPDTIQTRTQVLEQKRKAEDLWDEQERLRERQKDRARDTLRR
jgi:hypothetical protein